MVLSKNTRREILSLHLDGMSGFKIANELGINYRSAKRYCDKADVLVSELTLRIADAIKLQIKENVDFFTDFYSDINVNEEEDTDGEDTN